MDFSFTEDQIAIRDLAAQIFSDRASDEFLLDFSRNDETYDETLWNTLAEQGLLAITLPEAVGGSALGFVELCLMLEEQGRRVAPTPLFSSLVLGALPLMEFGTDAQQEKWLTPLASGQAKLTAAISLLGSTKAFAQSVDITNGKLNGTLTAVLDGAIANAIIVPAEDSVYIIDTQSEGVSTQQEQSFNGQTFATIELKDVDCELLGTEGADEDILNFIEVHADVAIAAMQQGICDEALKRTAEFSGERKQFGTPIGSFQAVAMRAADAYIDTEAMRSAYWGALWRVAEGLPSETEVKAAKYWACQGAHRVVHAAQHLHGGMGADIEYPIHRFFVMAKQLTFVSGNAATALRDLGELLASNDDTGLQSLAL